MNSEGSDFGISKRQRTRLSRVMRPHVLRYRPRRQSRYQPAGDPDSSSEESRPPSQHLCLPAGAQTRLITIRCVPAAPCAATATPPSADSDGGEATGTRLMATGPQAYWSTLTPLSAWPPEELGGTDGTGADTTHLSMGCDVVEASHTEDAASATPPFTECTPAAPQTPNLICTEVLPEEAATSGPVTPLMGSQILSAAEIPLQDEYIIDHSADGGEASQPSKYEPYEETGQLMEEYEPDGELLARALFRSAGRSSSAEAGGLWSGAACGENCSAEQSPDWKQMTGSLRVLSPDPTMFCDSSGGDLQGVTPGCRCSLAASYNKKMLLDQNLDVRILPADPLSPPEDGGQPESKASMAIQRLISSAVPPISAQLVHPRLYIDSETPGGWRSPREAAAAYTCGPHTSGGDPDSPPAADADQLLFLPSVGPAEETADPRLLPDGPTEVLTHDDLVVLDEPAASAPRGRGRGQKARGGARRSAKTAGKARRASRGRGRRGRGRGRGGARRVATVREDAGELFVHSADKQREDGCVSERAGAGGDGAELDTESSAEGRQPCHHFRRVVVGLADLGPQPLARTAKFQVWRRLGGSPERHDLCQCLDLSYLVLELPDGAVRYRCNICGKEFSLQSSVRRHHRMVHDDERRYTCAECSASYFQLSDLKRHLLASHTDLKPFTCRLCGEPFARHSDYRKHLDKHWC